AILQEMKGGDAKYVFASKRPGEPLSDRVMLRLVQRMPGYKGKTVHGMRASFKTWGALEMPRIRTEAVEMCIAHEPKGLDKHYLRTEFPEQRKVLMTSWARYITGAPAARVVRMRGR